MIKVCLDYQEITLLFGVAGEDLHKLPGQVLKHFFLEFFFLLKDFFSSGICFSSRKNLGFLSVNSSITPTQIDFDAEIGKNIRACEQKFQLFYRQNVFPSKKNK